MPDGPVLHSTSFALVTRPPLGWAGTLSWGAGHQRCYHAGPRGLIRVRVLGTGRRAVEIDAVVDTGFDDALTLPQQIITTLRLPLAGPAQAMLADGSVVRLNYYRATVLWEGTQRKIMVLDADGGLLVGMSLLYGSRVTLDVVDGGPVTIEPLP
jgi:clan AA aspartic protease